MSGFDAPKEWRDLLKEEYGPKGLWVFHIWVMGGTALALSAIALVLYGVYTKLVKPFFEVATGNIPRPTSFTDVAISMALTALLMLAVGYFVRRWFRRWETKFVDTVGDFLKEAVLKRLEYVETNASEFKSSIENLDWLKGQLALLDARVADFEKVASAGKRDELAAVLASRMLKGQTLSSLASIGREIVVHSAKYGADGHPWADVTDAVKQKQLPDGRIRVRVTNANLGCDPAKTIHKTLVVFWSKGGIEQKTVVPEKDWLEIS